MKTESPGRWGVFDVADQLWIGNSNGPIVFDREEWARAAATVFSEQLADGVGRFKAIPFVEGVFKYRDEIVPQRSPLEALRRIEGRAGGAQ